MPGRATKKNSACKSANAPAPRVLLDFGSNSRCGTWTGSRVLHTKPRSEPSGGPQSDESSPTCKAKRHCDLDVVPQMSASPAKILREASYFGGSPQEGLSPLI